MFCNQCEQAFHSVGCSDKAVCGKPAEVSDLFDLILYQVKGIAWMVNKARETGKIDPELDRFIIESLFLTVTNVNFDESVVTQWVYDADGYAVKAAELAGIDRSASDIPAAAKFVAAGMDEAALLVEAQKYPITGFNPNEDIQSLMQLLTYGLKGLAAYA